MLSEFIARIAKKEPVIIRSIISGEVKITLGKETYFLPGNGTLALTDLATHAEINASADLRELLKKGQVVLM